jgi:hypothetical protein
LAGVVAVSAAGRGFFAAACGRATGVVAPHCEQRMFLPTAVSGARISRSQPEHWTGIDMSAFILLLRSLNFSSGLA